MKRLSTILAITTLTIFGQFINLSHAQLINQRLIEGWSDQKILNKYKKRFVTVKLLIAECANKRINLCDQPQVSKVGAGFFVSNNGTLVTALHNVTLPDGLDPDKFKQSWQFEFLDSGGGIEKLSGQNYTMIYPRSEEDNLKDIAIFKLTQIDYKVNTEYFCTSTSPVNVRYSGHIFALKWRQKVDGSNDDVEKHLNIRSDQNRGDFIQTNGNFKKGESGSPILANGKVVGVITSGFDGVNNSGQFSPLSLVSHANDVIQSFGECALPGESLVIGPLSQEQFMHYDEGSIAWIRGYAGKVNWRARVADYHLLNKQEDQDRIEDYRIDFSELATGDCSSDYRELMLVFNHHFPKNNSCDITYKDRTWYQIQITPRVKEDVPFRKSVLVHRSGTFLRYDQRADKYLPIESNLDDCKKHRCSKKIDGMSPEEFGDLNSSEAAIASMDQKIGFQWHGLTRKDKSSNTHIVNYERAYFWRHSDIGAQSNYSSKNFLVRYYGNPSYGSDAPPAVNVCVSKDWQSLSVEWSSPERCVRPRTVRIHLNSAD